MQKLIQLLHGLSLIARNTGLPHQDVHRGVVLGGLDGQTIARGGQATFLCEVTVDHRVVGLTQVRDQNGSVNFLEIEVLQLLDGVNIDVTACGDLNKTVRSKEAKCALLVGDIGDHANDSALFGKLIQRLVLGGVDSQGLEVNALTGSEVVVELLLSLLQIGNGLVVGGINFTLIQRAVGQIVVGEFLDVDVDSRVLCVARG